MKKEKLTIKQLVEKKIEFRNKQLVFIDKKGENKMDERTRLRIHGNPNKRSASTYDMRELSNSERTKLRVGDDSNFNLGPYQKKAFVDYDVVICIPSRDRYEKVKRLIKQFHTQSTRYTFRIILLNDGSTELNYDCLTTEFPDLVYLINKKPNGKALHWYCYNQLWESLRNITCHAVLQMDDDFILSDGFLNAIMDLFFQQKELTNSMMAIAPHTWSFKVTAENEKWWSRKDFVDGIALIDDAVIKHMDYKMKPVDIVAVSKPGNPVRAWTQISEEIKVMGGWIFRTDNSLVYHDGNDDSKLHGDVRSQGRGGVYTQKYIGNL